MVSIGETRNAYKILLQKSFGEPEESLEDNIETDLRKVDCEDKR